ncbi:hypothetical protein GCM10022631_34550 [Deinococcus rubellus]|uniref:GNAT family N-acetyltransferase n=1 Tax=Deinococcus rubellus TaxID=1889240 RepID=A0ABY5YEK5_9DEIO|nr:GNAT family N-acetyltransferase [Deinococcus rubellus]UWX63510.1 GNAT family N-acetyltransferase [Deinococcus rubellus]
MPPHLPSPAELAEFSLATQHPLTLQWLDDQTRLKRFVRIHGFDLQLAADLELAGQRAGFFKVGQDAQAFLNRWASVPPDLHAMLSIRFQGLDVTRPFVDASLLSRPLTELDLPALAEVAREVYGAFRPLYLRLWSAAPDGHFPETQPDKRFLAAPISELIGANVPPELSTQPTQDLSHYAEAQAAYEAVNAGHPAHTEQAALESREDLQESLEAGTLFDVLVRGEWAGYVATTETFEADTLGLNAYVVQELILSPHFRGRGYGAALSTLLARSLPDQSRVLIGTIHAENRGAITAALLAGRVDVGGWVQVGL